MLVPFQYMAGKSCAGIAFYRALERLVKRLFIVPRRQVGFRHYALFQLPIVGQLGRYYLFGQRQRWEGWMSTSKWD
jgi:hypothetical protein